MKHIVRTVGVIAMITYATNPGIAADIQAVNPTGLYDPTTNGYSHVVAAGGFAFIAGQGGETQTGDLSEQHLVVQLLSKVPVLAVVHRFNIRPRNGVELLVLLWRKPSSVGDLG